jgi:hypothetical protein
MSDSISTGILPNAVFFVFSHSESMHLIKSEKMKRIIIIALLTFTSLAISAQDSGIGVGIIIGEPTGFSAKSWLSSNDALDAGVAWSMSNGWFHLHADYLRHAFELIPVEKGKLPLYFGIGARIGFGPDVQIGARVPLGINYLFDDVPLDIFLEVAPGMLITPDTKFDMGGGIGVRYWF